MSDTTGFVVKAFSINGLSMWLSPNRPNGSRAFGPRSDAEVFKTRSDAHMAIGKMPIAFEDSGFVFTVEAAE